jgi:hypothetical protein
VAEFRIAGVDGSEAFILFTLINDRFVSLSGEGDFDQLALIAHTLRTVSAP